MLGGDYDVTLSIMTRLDPAAGDSTRIETTVDGSAKARATAVIRCTADRKVNWNSASRPTSKKCYSGKTRRGDLCIAVDL